jgi:predicted outer membrane repeat protein
VYCASNTFISNTAQSRGGAIFSDSAAGNLHLYNSTFNDNICVGNGGAIFITATSGIQGCQFRNNTAGVNGGAVYTDFGVVANMSDCVFDHNSAEQAGAAWFGFGLNQSLHYFNTSFHNSVAACCYADGYGNSLQSSTEAQADPLTCSDTDSGQGGDNCCSGNQYSDGAQCLPCLHGGDCSTVGSSLISQRLQPGYWRAAVDTNDVRECWYAAACGGDVNKSGSSSDSRGLSADTTELKDLYCAAGYTGPYCAVCLDGYSPSVGYRCTKCRKTTRAAIFTVLGVALFMIAAALIMMIVHLLELTSNGAGGHIGNALNRLIALPWGKLRIPIVAFQIVTEFTSVTGLVLPNLYRMFLSWVNIMNLNFGWMLSLGCLTHIDFYDKLLLETLIPPVLALILLITYMINLHNNQVRPVMNSSRTVVPQRTSKLEKALAKHQLAFLAMTFLLYSTVSTTIFQTFACDTVDQNHQTAQYLRADYSIRCDSSTHTAYQIYAGVMILVYPLGIPLLFSYLLYRHRAKLSSAYDASARTLSRDRDVSLRSTSFLWTPYRSGMYYWEVIECVRRILLTGMIVFIAPGTAAQAAVACILALFSIVAVLYFRPHKDQLDAHIYLAGTLIIFFSMFLSLAIKVNLSTETHSSQKIFGFV